MLRFFTRQNNPYRTRSDQLSLQSGLPDEISQFLNGIGSITAAHRLINPMQPRRYNKLCGEPDQQVKWQIHGPAQIKDEICPTRFQDPIYLV